MAAAEPATGVVAGRVVNLTSGNFLHHARVAVRGTTIETTTNEVGEYRLPGVPVGEVQVAVTFLGMEPQVEPARVVADQTVRRDFSLCSPAGRRPRAGSCNSKLTRWSSAN